MVIRVIYVQIKQRSISWHSFCLGSTSKDFTKDKQSEFSLNRTSCDFSADYSPIFNG